MSYGRTKVVGHTLKDFNTTEYQKCGTGFINIAKKSKKKYIAVYLDTNERLFLFKNRKRTKEELKKMKKPKFRFGKKKGEKIDVRKGHFKKRSDYTAMLKVGDKLERIGVGYYMDFKTNKKKSRGLKLILMEHIHGCYFLLPTKADNVLVVTKAIRSK